jgi:hypothetical protein
MTRAWPRSEVDRAAVVLGVVSLVGVPVSRAKGTFAFVHLGHHGYLVALVGGLLAVLGGWFALRPVVGVVGAGYVALAVTQAVLIGRQSDPFGGDGSTVSFWLGLGVGLLALAATPRAAPPA